MTTREEAIHACLIDSSVYPDTPFHDANWTIIRHQENQKICENTGKNPPLHA